MKELYRFQMGFFLVVVCFCFVFVFCFFCFLKFLLSPDHVSICFHTFILWYLSHLHKLLKIFIMM